MEAEKKAIEEEKHAAHVLAQAKKLRQAAELKAEAEVHIRITLNNFFFLQRRDFCSCIQTIIDNILFLFLI
jgi:hypothetical protein